MNIDKRLLKLAKANSVSLFLTIFLGFLGGLLIVGQANYLSKIVNRVFLEGAGIDDVSKLLAVLVVIFILRAGLLWGKEAAAKNVAVAVKNQLRKALFQKVLERGPAFTHGERTGELIGVFYEGIEALDAYFSQYLPQLVLAAFIPITFLLFVFPRDFLSGIILLVTAPLIPFFMALIGSMADSLTKKQWKTLSRMSAHFLDVLQGLTTLKILGRSKEQAAIIAGISDRFRVRTMGVLKVAFLSALTLEMLTTISTAVIAVEIGLRLLAGKMLFEQALFILLLAPEFYLPLRMLGSRFHAGMSGVAASGRIFAILEDRQWQGGEMSDSGEQTGEPGVPREIRFKEVAFHYPDGRGGLEDVDLHLVSGEKIALVGPSGAGKTTVVQLLMKYILPEKGAIIIDGHPLMQISGSRWREKIAWVPQTPYLFDTTIFENIRIAKPDAAMADVVGAAKLAHIHDFVRMLDDGYDTIIGERGARLSGGQAQRIALARAFLKDAPLLILDEPSANLDPVLEAQIQESIRLLTKEKMVLVIAHRLQTVMDADRIYVLDDGRIVQQGTHHHLAATEGVYRGLVREYATTHDKTNALTAPDEISKARRFPPDKHETAVHSPRPDYSNREDKGKSAHGIWMLRRLLSFLVPYRKWVLASVLFGFLTIGSSIGLMGSSAYIISLAALHPSIADLQVAIVGVRFFGIARGFFRYLERYVSHQVTFRLLAGLRVWFYQAIEPLAPAKLLGLQSGDLLSRILSDIGTLENFYVRAVSPPLVASLVALLAAGLLYGYDPALAGVFILFFLVSGLIIPLVVYQLSKTAGRKIPEIRSKFKTSLVDGVQGLAELMAFGKEREMMETVLSESRALGVEQKKLAHVEGFQHAVISLLTNMAMWSVLFLGIGLVVHGKMNGVYLAVIALITWSAFEAVNPLPDSARNLAGNLAAGKRLFELTRIRPAVVDVPEPSALSASRDIRIERLSFAYPAMNETGAGNIPVTARQVLRNVSLKIPEGSSTALVGPSGSGKSTIVKLLLRFWDFREGEISLGGRDIRSLSQDDVRKQIALVSQSTYLFNATIADNIRISRPDASFAEIEEAARKAQLHPFIQTLPDGYQTWVGEQGVLLSGGERQRVAIARAILKNAPILILDEPTSNLDSVTEREIIRMLQGLMQGKTTLLITHRLVGMDAMDEIVVLYQGAVAERGSHRALLREGGLYRRMWTLQQQFLPEN